MGTSWSWRNQFRLPPLLGGTVKREARKDPGCHMDFLLESRTSKAEDIRLHKSNKLTLLIGRMRPKERKKRNFSRGPFFLPEETFLFVFVFFVSFCSYKLCSLLLFERQMYYFKFYNLFFIVFKSVCVCACACAQRRNNKIPYL